MPAATMRPAPDEEKRKAMRARRDASTERGVCVEGVRWWLSVKDKSVSSSAQLESAGWEKVFGLGWAKRPEAHWKAKWLFRLGIPELRNCGLLTAACRFSALASVAISGWSTPYVNSLGTLLRRGSIQGASRSLSCCSSLGLPIAT